MRLPSVKPLSAVFGDRAKEARELLEGVRNTRQYESVKTWEAQCLNPPSYHERLMCALDEIAETHGVEALWGAGQYWPEYEYLNAGDTYAPTLIYKLESGRFFVGCWGDLVEKHPHLR